MRGAIPPYPPMHSCHNTYKAQKKFYEYEKYGVFAVWLKPPEGEADHSHT
jgi:hypothetical protein